MTSKTKFCYHCGAELPLSAKFCTKCGADLRKYETNSSRNSTQNNQIISEKMKQKKDDGISHTLTQKTHKRLLSIGFAFLIVTLLYLAFRVKRTNDLINDSFSSTIRQWVNQVSSIFPDVVIFVGTFVAVAILSFAWFNRRDARFAFVSFLFSITAAITMVLVNQELTDEKLYEAVNTIAIDRLSGSKQLFTFSYDHYLADFDETDTAYSCGVYTFKKDGTLLVNAESIASNQRKTPQDAAEVYKENEGLPTENAADDRGTWRVSNGVLFLNYGNYKIAAGIVMPYELGGNGEFGYDKMTPKIAGHKFDAIDLSCAGLDYANDDNSQGKLSITDDGKTYDLKGGPHNQGAREFTLYWPKSLVK